MKLILEFWANGRKEAELPAKEVWKMSRRDYDSFWYVQDTLDRTVMVRYEGGKENE